MEIRLLGPLEVRVDGAPVRVGAGKPRALLALLALESGRPVASERLIDGLWEEGRAPASAAKQVQLYVSQLRKLGLPIVTRGRAYALEVEPDAVDALRFETLVRAGDGQAALALWRGRPLADAAEEPFASETIRRLEELWLEARELALDAALERGEHRAVVTELDALVAEHPLRERLHAQRMLALYRCGRQADALEAFRHARTVLDEQVGLEPGRALRELNDRILQQDASLSAAEPEAWLVRARRRPRRRVAALAVVAAAALLVAGILLLGGEKALPGIDGNSVGFLDAAEGRITEQIQVGNEPAGVAVGGGSLWVVNGQDGTVSRIDRDRSAVTTIDVGELPTALAFGEDALWVTDAESRSVLQVDPRSNRVAGRFAVGNSPRAVAVGFDALWVASSIDDRVDRIDLATGRSMRLSVPGAPAGLAIGKDAVWVATETAGRVARLDPRTGAAIASVAVGSTPTAIAAGDEDVWVVNRGDATVSRIDSGTGVVTDTLDVGDHPVALALGQDDVWVGDADGRLVTIDRASADVQRTDELGGAPTALALDGDALVVAAAPPLAALRGGTLEYATAAFACGCFDPAGYDAGTWPLLASVYDGLVGYRHAGGAAGTVIVPNLAERLPESADDGLTYVFRLRQGLVYSDGSPVRAGDFRASLERLFRVASDGTAESLYGAVRGAANCDPDRCDLSGGIVVDNAARTITIRLSAPDPEFLHKLAMPLANVVPARSPPRLATDEPLLGTGPYRVADLGVGGGRLERNPGFETWSIDASPDGFPDAIEWRFGSDPMALVDDVESGDVDLLPASPIFGVAVPERELEAFALRSPGRVTSTVLPQTDYLFLDTTVAPFDDVRTRRALNFAIDRDRLVELAGGEQVAAPTCQILPPGLPGYEPICPYTFDPDASGGWKAPDLARAQQLADAAGNQDAPVTFLTFNGPFAGLAQHAAQVMRGLGYDAGVRVIADQERYFGSLFDPATRPQAGVTAWVADFLTASSFFQPNFTCDARDGLNNLSEFCDAGTEAAARRAVDRGGEAWAAVDRRIVDMAPAVPTINRRALVLASEQVGSVQQHPLYGPLPDQSWVR